MRHPNEIRYCHDLCETLLNHPLSGFSRFIKVSSLLVGLIDGISGSHGGKGINDGILYCDAK
jgi:hypothetical protein